MNVFPPEQTVHLDIRVGERTNNYTEIAAKHNLSELRLRIRQLAEQIEQIQRENDYQRVSLSVCVCACNYQMGRPRSLQSLCDESAITHDAGVYLFFKCRLQTAL